MLQVQLQIAQVEAELGKALASLERAVGVQLNEHPPDPREAGSRRAGQARSTDLGQPVRQRDETMRPRYPSIPVSIVGAWLGIGLAVFRDRPAHRLRLRRRAAQAISPSAAWAGSSRTAPVPAAAWAYNPG